MSPSAQKTTEGKAKIDLSEGTFYNPEMRFCRDISVLAVASLPIDGKNKLDVCDAMTASGVRGIRYALECENVGSVALVDYSKKAITLARKNVKLNKLPPSRAKVFFDDASRFLLNTITARRDFDLIELDPFGSPVPFLHASVAAARKKVFYLSVTATDTAVLCGAHHAACIKNYQCKPLDNEFCHENAIRILLAKIARTASEKNYGITPLFSLSKRHYVKVFVQLNLGAEAAEISARNSLGYITHCAKCLRREIHDKPGFERKCSCGQMMDYAGPIWVGNLWDEKFVRKMQTENEKRKLENKKEIAKFLSLISEELSLPATYWDLHEICEKHKVKTVATEKVLAKLKQAGFQASRTHFSPTSIRTDASLEEILKAMSS
ncbi:tRNA (guanine(26)-N(2))-dimethyltransferase [Candidatus Gugararchaeum adminiculabundum]|nr:tRNA (guanine(26)-N(2))-dimethyltransferase [Candidatus Gugararchaeum adminiculabundum]